MSHSSPSPCWYFLLLCHKICAITRILHHINSIYFQMLLWSLVYSALSETSFLPCPELIIFLISDFSLPKFLPAVSLNLKAFEWFPCPWFPASFISFSFENILLVKGWYFVLGFFPLASCAYLPAHPRLVVSDLSRRNDSSLFGLGKNRISLLDFSS